MKNELTLFKNDEFSVRAMLDEAGELWVDGDYVLDALNLRTSTQAIYELNADEKKICEVNFGNEKGFGMLININGLYKLAEGKNTLTAHRFYEWIKNVVIPEARKYWKQEQETTAPSTNPERTRMGRPKNAIPNVKFSLYLPEDLLKKLEWLADFYHQTTTSLIAELLSKSLENYTAELQIFEQVERMKEQLRIQKGEK